MTDHFMNYASLSISAAKQANTYEYNSFRFSVITDRLLRIEIQADNKFCDQPTQAILNRSFADPIFTVTTENGLTSIQTSAVTFFFDHRRKQVSKIVFANGKEVTDYHKDNLKGTRRTLDGSDGKAALGDGVISENGVAILDDSQSLIIADNGKIVPREAKEKDIYFFAYGHDYVGAVRDFLELTGKPPLIPRFAFGNWWSRYKAYTQEEYSSLMQRFEDEKIPITVATIDMDWHWVDVVGKFGPESRDQTKAKGPFELFYNVMSPGWTGYSWNTDLFPDPEKFLAFLREKNLKITMNLHPASGCKFYEDAYHDFAEFMGIDPKTRQQIRFDLNDEKFLEGYFRFLHHPHEENGVDFWWIDWQQGKKSSVPGLDPLWELNHYHSLDSGRNGKRPLILSRFAGAGSHRYPLGFSGDTAQSWATLDFQPYFTATASNIGYTWWSHDIGGHHFGERNDELYLRWVQFGIFSPIMRLHSTSNEFMGKEPWKYRAFAEEGAKKAMRFRHRLIPYLYSMNRRTQKYGRALIEPMYYGSPDDTRAYKAPNEYRFGSELIVCPITTPTDKKTGLASVPVFLPEGRYTDLFTDRIYTGGFLSELYRDEGSIPVLAKEGAIIPLDCNETNNYCGNPENMEILIFRGNSSFTMYEDDGESMNYVQGEYCETEFRISEKDVTTVFTVSVKGPDPSVLPPKRNMLLTFRDIRAAETINVKRNGIEEEPIIDSDPKYLQIDLRDVAPTDEIEITLRHTSIRKSPCVRELKTELISRLQGGNTRKMKYVSALDNNEKAPAALKGAFRELELLY